MLGNTCRAPVSFVMGMLLEDYLSIEMEEVVTFATVYLAHDRFIPPVVRASVRASVRYSVVKCTVCLGVRACMRACVRACVTLL